MMESTYSPGEPAHSRHVLRGLLVGTCFFLAAAASAWLIDARLPFPTVPDVGSRLQYFAGKKDEFDTIFAGSSRVRHQIIPRQFDAETAAGGLKTHAINLGYSGMWPPESFYFLHRLLALHPRHLRWVVVELMDHRAGQADYQAPTMRMVYWHDWRHTAMAFRLAWELPLPITEKAHQFARHAWMFLQHMTNPGRGADWLKAHYFPKRDKSNLGWIDRAGFDPEEKGEWSESARADYAKRIQAFQQSLAPRLARPGLAAALQSLIDEVHQAGAEPIFILPPSVLPEENIGAGLPPGMTVWAFNNPAEYPRLYLPELHYDPGHLNEDGAREFTRLLAQRLADLAQKR